MLFNVILVKVMGHVIVISEMLQLIFRTDSSVNKLV